MIYSPNNNEPLVLVEADADSFLESVGVKLYDNEISINGTLYEGSYGESILAENGIFLYEDGIVLEGKQAEEYKARKAKERVDKNKTELDRANHRYAPVGSWDNKNGGYKNAPTGWKNRKGLNPNYSSTGADKEEKMHNRADRILNKDEYKKSSYADPENRVDPSKYSSGHKSIKPKGYAGTQRDFKRDALMRHMRRHPKQYKESTIFSNIEII